MRLATKLTWKECKRTGLIERKMDALPIDERVPINIALDQFQHRPELGKHYISKKEFYFQTTIEKYFLEKQSWASIQFHGS